MARSAKMTAHIVKIRECLQSHGYLSDRWGNMKKITKSGKVRRMKFGKAALRYEVQTTVNHTFGPDQKMWVRLASAAYGKITIKDNKLGGMSR